MFLAVRMPGVDGHELAGRLRRRRNCPLLVAVSDLGTAGDVRRAFAARFDRHVLKPAHPDAVVNLLRSYGETLAAAS